MVNQVHRVLQVQVVHQELQALQEITEVVVHQELQALQEIAEVVVHQELRELVDTVIDSMIW